MNLGFTKATLIVLVLSTVIQIILQKIEIYNYGRVLDRFTTTYIVLSIVLPMIVFMILL